MDSAVYLISFILPIAASTGLALTLAITMYIKLRKRFLVKVNCWFCNQWTKVPYDNQNCFECPTCLQYNGFNKDGDYNRPIPAQRDEMMNIHLLPFSKRVDNQFVGTSVSSNGLCQICNNNQQLKIFQLAHFIPLNEDNYDVEIEHFQKQLEKAYRLCPSCENVLKTTIQKQSCLLGLKFTELRKKGVQLLDLNSSFNGISKKNKILFLVKFIKVVLVCFACLNFMLALGRIDFSDKNLKRHTSKSLFVYVLTIKNLCLSIFNVCQNVWEYILRTAGFITLSGIYDNTVASSGNLVNNLLQVPLIEKSHIFVQTAGANITSVLEECLQPNLPKISNVTLMCSVGVMLQLVILIMNDRNLKKGVCFILWITLSWMNWKDPFQQYLNVNFYVDVIQVVASLIIIIATLSSMSTHNPINSKRKKMKRLSSKRTIQQDQHNTNNYLGQFSDCEDETIIPKPPAFQNNSTNVKPVFEPKNVSKSFQDIRFTATNNLNSSLSSSFTSAKNYINSDFNPSNTANSVFNFSVNEQSPSDDDNNRKLGLFDIDVSLNRLHLGTSKIKPNLFPTASHNSVHVSKNVQRPRPVISPAKLKNVTQNSWVAGGFWRDPNAILLPVNSTNLSRSSSQTSGFASLELQNNYNSFSSSLNNSFCSDFDCNSVVAESAYCMMPPSRNFACHSNTYYPVFNRRQMVCIAPCGFNNVFANHQNIPFNSNSKFSQELPNNAMGLNAAATYKTYKTGSLLNEYLEKDF